MHEMAAKHHDIINNFLIKHQSTLSRVSEWLGRQGKNICQISLKRLHFKELTLPFSF